MARWRPAGSAVIKRKMWNLRAFLTGLRDRVRRPKIPAMDPAGFLNGRTRETTIRRDAEGQWFHDGEPLEHDNLTRAFDSWVELADDGRYCLKNDINWAYITLEGPAHFVRSLRVQGEDVWLRLSNGQEQELSADTLRQDDRDVLYCDVCDGRLTARFDRHAATQLSDLLGEDDDGVYVRIGGQRHRPPVVADPLGPKPS